MRRFAFLTLILLSHPVKAAVTIDFEPQAIVANGITAGADVAFFGVGLKPDGYESEVVRWADVVPGTKGSTTARLVIGEAVPFKSVWAVVDIHSGEFVLVGSPGYRVRRVIVPKHLLKAGEGDQPDILTQRAEFIELLVVRPNKGAWRFQAMDGLGDDDNRDDGHISASLDHFQAVGATKETLHKLSAKDVIVMIDPARMEAWAITADDALSGSAP